MIPFLFAAVLVAQAPADPVAVAMNSLTQLNGDWTCKTAQGSTVQKHFAIAPDGNLTLHEGWKNGDNAGTWDQTFRVDSDTHTLSTRNVGSNGWVFTGTSSGFDGNVIEFDGSQATQVGTVPTREQFTFSKDGQFEHVWIMKIGKDWTPTSSAECARAR